MYIACVYISKKKNEKNIPHINLSNWKKTKKCI